MPKLFSDIILKRTYDTLVLHGKDGKIYHVWCNKSGDIVVNEGNVPSFDNVTLYDPEWIHEIDSWYRNRRWLGNDGSIKEHEELS